MTTAKKNLMTPNKMEGSFVLTSSIDGRKTMNPISRNKKKKVHAAIGKVKGPQTSRNLVKINGVSSRMTGTSKGYSKSRYSNKNSVSRTDRALESLTGLSAQISHNFDKDYQMQVGIKFYKLQSLTKSGINHSSSQKNLKIESSNHQSSFGNIYKNQLIRNNSRVMGNLKSKVS